MVISSGTIIQRKSEPTAGAIRARGRKRFTDNDPRVLLVVPGLLHLALGRSLRGLQRRVHRALAGERRAHLLADSDADGLELRDGGELHAYIRALGQRAVVRVGGVDGSLFRGRELGGLQEVRVAYVLLRVPVGTVPQPLVLPTSAMY